MLLGALLSADQITGTVIDAVTSESVLLVKLATSGGEFQNNETIRFKVGIGDREIGYKDRLIRAKAVYYANNWHLESLFPIDGLQAEIAQAINNQLHEDTSTKTRRRALRDGDYIPNFALLDQNGRFSQIKQLRGKPFVLNFIFTRCMVPEMCPAATAKMSELQVVAEQNNWENLNFVSITMDPTFDSPGILNEYMQLNDLKPNNFHLLTHFDPSVVEDILYQFGILTRDENNTITHTMTTFLIDANGKIIYAKDGPRWSVDSMMKAAEPLFN